MNAAQHILVAAIRLYRWVVSPAKTFIFGPLGQCRFTPSCSAYALEAIARHGAALGCWLALKRLGRCHPWGGCGDDPVPPITRPGLGAQGLIRPTLQNRQLTEKDRSGIAAQPPGARAIEAGDYAQSTARP